VVITALRRTGHAGLRDAAGVVPFAVEAESVTAAPLGSWVARAVPPASLASHALATIRLVTPCYVDRKGRKPGFELGRILGQMAHDLVQWELVDDGRAWELGRVPSDALSEAARRQAEDALKGLTIRTELRWADLGARYSHDNAQRFRLCGWVGRVRVEGDLTALMPWLLVLSLRGAGGKKSYGLGQVEVSVECRGRSPAPHGSNDS
jgi:hypothetical protein